MPTPRRAATPPTSRKHSPALTSGFCLLILAALPIAAQAQTAPAERTKSRSNGGAGASLKPGDSGSVVEDLQRRLNSELDPSPRLDVDGDYGTATRDAVTRFQRAKGLEPSGIADAATRRTL